MMKVWSLTLVGGCIECLDNRVSWGVREGKDLKTEKQGVLREREMESEQHSAARPLPCSQTLAKSAATRNDPGWGMGRGNHDKVMVRAFA